MNDDWIIEFETDDGLRVVIEDDGDVAYAYLYEGRKSNGLVWLYNRVPAPPDGPEWNALLDNAPEKPPLNASDKIDHSYFAIPGPDDVAVTWNKGDRGVGIYVRGLLHATIPPGAFPGKCSLAVKDGKLANTFTH